MGRFKIRRPSGGVKAFGLALLVHAALVGLLVIGFRWQSAPLAPPPPEKIVHAKTMNDPEVDQEIERLKKQEEQRRQQDEEKKRREEATKKKAEVDRYYDEMLLKAKAEAEKQKVTIIKEAHTLEETVINDARRQGEEIIASANKAAELALGEVDARVQERANVRAAELLTQVLTDLMMRHLHVLLVKDLL